MNTQKLRPIKAGAFNLNYSVSISEGTTVLSGTYQHKGTPSPDYDNYDEWKKTYLKDVSVTCIDKGAISATYLVETDDGSLSMALINL